MTASQKFTVKGVEVEALPQDTILEQFRVEAYLAHGGMGAIYRGSQVRTGQAVAIKENFITTPDGIAQFRREGEILVKLGKHPHLPLVYDYFIIGERQYLVMEFIEGRDLSEMTKTAQGREALPVAQALNIIIQICSAVTHLHSQEPPILHRDIKPQNVKVSPAGVAVLVDFGLAKMDGHDSETQTGAQGLTYGFAPPEQYTGATRTQPASDIYALGATLYAVLTAQRPPDSLRLALGDLAFEPPHRINPAVPARLSRAIEQAMQPKPGDRPQSVAAWQAELQAILAELNLTQQSQTQGASAMVTPTAGPEPAEHPQGQDIFISYSRKDEAFIKRLYQELTNSGLSAWYDRLNIGVGEQWASEIVTGIRDCQVFVLVLSPGSAASPNVRKEVDLAQRYDRRIIPLIWQPVEIPVAMEYQLAGIQWIEFNGSTAPEKFEQLANVIKRLIGGASMAEATSNTAIAKPSTIAPIPEEMPEAPEAAAGRPRRLNRFKKAEPKINPVVVGSLVISGVVTTFGLDVEQQDFVDEELKWLFSATAHLYSIQNGQVDSTAPVPVPLPPDVVRKDPAANNQVLASAVALPQSSTFMDNLENLLNKRLKEQLDILNKQLLPRAAQLGGAAATDAVLQADLKGRRISIVELLVELARTISQVYGVYVASPEELLEIIRGD